MGDSGVALSREVVLDELLDIPPMRGPSSSSGV